MNDRIAVTFADGVADVRLTRADKMNALDPAMFDAIIATLDQLNGQKGLRAVVLSGEGKAFCAGLDMGSFATMLDPDRKGMNTLVERTHGEANRFQQVVWGWRMLPVPVIAAVHGTAFGGGFQLMLGADMRYVAPATRLSIMEIKWGLIPDMAGTQIMHHLAREDIVRELTFSGRVFSAEEGERFGFVTRLADDPRAAALEMAREIASKSPQAIRAAKRLFNQAGLVHPLDGLTMEAVEQQKLVGSPSQMEAVMANLEKRSPRFVD